MKLFCCAVALGVVGSSVSANMLVNGDLDDPGVHESDAVNGWTLTEPGGVNSATFASFADHTSAGPGGVGLWFRPFESGQNGDEPVDAFLEQSVAAAPGVEYTLTAWFKFEEHFSGFDGATNTEARLYMNFYAAGDVFVGGVSLSVCDPGFNDSEWRQRLIGGVAPAGTVEIRVGASMIDGVLADANPQSGFVDDFVLVPTPGAAGVMMVFGAGVFGRRRR
jgi:hypothetical protein